jgi:uncharacterized protein (UPF0548 family)
MESLERLEPTYVDLGATLLGIQPDGFHHDRYVSVLGRGSKVFSTAAEGLRTWKAHGVAGVRVFPQGQEVRQGETVVVTFGLPFAALAAPCRIVGVVEGRDRWGFAYGTLPGHPEQGEEAFIVSISSDETV